MKGKVEAIGKGGYGIVFREGKTVFVPYVIEGEEIEFEIEKKKSSVYFGKAVEIIKSSEKRVKPVCKYYGVCGGCNFQHISYNYQLELKKKILINNLKRIAKVEIPFEVETIPSPFTEKYRTKVTFKIINGKIGFFKRNSNELIEIEECIIANEKINDFLKEIKGNNLIESVKKGEIIVLSNGEKISAVLKSGRKKNYLTDEKGLFFELLGLKYFFTPISFIQSNLYNLKTMLSLLREEIEKGGESAADLFSGTGFFAMLLSKYFKKVYSYEIKKENIKLQEKNKNINSIENIKIISGNILRKNMIFPSELFVIDPPRGGITKKVIKRVAQAFPEKIIYFSCDSATFSRDTFYFKEKGYSLKKLKILDNFPHSDHFEIFSVFEKAD